jgi:hypothetical protein
MLLAERKGLRQRRQVTCSAAVSVLIIVRSRVAFLCYATQYRYI